MKFIVFALALCFAAQLAAGRDVPVKSGPNLFANYESIAKQIKAKTESIFEKVAEDMKKVEEDVKQAFGKFADTMNICKINGTDVKCCAKDFFKNDLCLGLSVDTQNVTVTYTFSVNNRTFINKTISVKNPAPICAALPQLPIIKVCVEPYNLTIIDNNSIQFCLILSARVAEKSIARVDLNCMRLKNNGEITFQKRSANSTVIPMLSEDTAKLPKLIDNSFNPLKWAASNFLKKN